MRSLLNFTKRQTMIEVMNSFILGDNNDFLGVLDKLSQTNPGLLVSYEQRVAIPNSDRTTNQSIRKLVPRTAKKIANLE